MRKLAFYSYYVVFCKITYEDDLIEILFKSLVCERSESQINIIKWKIATKIGFYFFKAPTFQTLIKQIIRKLKKKGVNY